MKKNHTVLLVGLNPQGLFLLREFSRLKYTVLAMGKSSEIGFHSRYGEKIKITNEKELKNKLIQLAGEYPEKLKCYISSGFYLAFFIREFTEIFELFDVYPHQKEDLEILSNKLETYGLAKKAGVHSLPTVILSLIDKDYNNIKFPAIIKWSKDIYLFKKAPFKTKTVNNTGDLNKLLNVCSDNEKKNLIIQPYLGDDLTNNFSFGAYFNKGILISGIAVNEVRHYVSGISSYVKEINGRLAREIKSTSEKLISLTRFTGFLDVEYKLYNNKPCLLEVNPRPFGFIKILKLKFPNILECIEKNNFDQLQEEEKLCAWTNIIRDLITKFNICYKNRKIKILFEKTKKREYKIIYDVWDIRDLKPFVFQIFKGLSLTKV